MLVWYFDKEIKFSFIKIAFYWSQIKLKPADFVHFALVAINLFLTDDLLRLFGLCAYVAD
jgi:hypothetical protein